MRFWVFFDCTFIDNSKVCKIADIIAKFSDDAKKPLGVDITIDSCANYLLVRDKRQIYITEDDADE